MAEFSVNAVTTAGLALIARAAAASQLIYTRVLSDADAMTAAAAALATPADFSGPEGNELSNVGTISIERNSSNALTVTRTGYSGSINVRCVIFTLDTPTFYAWLRTDKANKTVSSGSVNVLYDESGNTISYDSNSSYKAIGVIVSSGANCSNERNVLIYSAMLNSGGHLAFELSQAQTSISAAKIWYIKTPTS